MRSLTEPGGYRAVPPPGASGASIETLHQKVRQFYVLQAQLLDRGDVEAWAATFTEDAVFVQSSHRDRVFAGNSSPERRGRPAIAQAAGRGVAARAATGVTRRYWVDAHTVRRSYDLTLRTRFNALLIETPAGGPCRIFLSVAGEDILIPHGGAWQVSRRTIFHDDAG
ncbi:hypothetical protein FHS43_001697 [Streptosporangium becharense]|uniref:SnoaL-like domain-containing protein n=1 Tax=Streptosporangium becharense TaxID=1816182 RepID=A0A7W9ILZ2_9ACTN|nr:nuclear transport factor 2 family protein [Streptosporangium becharense]MBB2910434.1 hypothetical protein [Streptosporangium becharense]MBB5823177.1 hypothetical protein [Streptosporangium becharense]